MNSLTIKITDISGGKGKAFRAVISELGNSIIYGDTVSEIFKVLPEVIKSSKKTSDRSMREVTSDHKKLKQRGFYSSETP